MSRIYLMRHGDIRCDGVKRFTGQTDLPLCAAGRAQAVKAREVFAELDCETVWCSDLSRSLETARILLADRSEAPTIMPALREIGLGEWDGKSFDEVKRSYPDMYAARGVDLAAHRPPGGENFLEVEARVWPAFERIVRETERACVVVGHAGVNRVILCRILGMPMDNLLRFRQDYAHVNVIRSGPEGFKVEAVNADARSLMAQE